MNKDTITVVWGDSLVYGLYDYEFGGWVNRLRIKLNNKDKSNFVLNLGIPGENSSNILLRFEDELKNRYNEEDNFKFIFGIGIKDSLLLNRDKKYLSKFINNLKNIISISSKYTSDICFIGLVKPDVLIRKEYVMENVLKIDKAIEKQCKLSNINYVKMRNIISISDLYDGLHPNSVGYEKMCKIIMNENY